MEKTTGPSAMARLGNPVDEHNLKYYERTQLKNERLAATYNVILIGCIS